MRTLGKEFSHLLCLPYGQMYTLLRSIYYHKWHFLGNNPKYKPGCKLIKQFKQALSNKCNQKENRHRQSHMCCTECKV